MGRLVAGILIVTALLAACGSPTRSTTTGPAADPSVAVGQQLLDELPPTDSPTPGPQRTNSASFSMRLSDDNDLHPAGIPVRMTGPVTRTITSDARGYVSGSVPPGIYRFKVVEGCHDSVIVTKGGSGQAGVVEGRTTQGTLLLLWQHRYGPSPPVYSEYGGESWPVGRPITLSFAVEDHCETELAPDRRIPSYAFRTSTNLKLVGTPALRAGSDGRTEVTVACTKKSETVRLDVYDRENPGDTMDLIQQVIGYTGFVHCVEDQR
jgi:hypothetical protein